jgi:hypothetical protein
MEIDFYFGNPNEDYAIDNVAMTLERPTPGPAPVPLPAGAFLLASALGGLGLKRALSMPRKEGTSK